MIARTKSKPLAIGTTPLALWTSPDGAGPAQAADDHREPVEAKQAVSTPQAINFSQCLRCGRMILDQAQRRVFCSKSCKGAWTRSRRE